MLHVDFESLLKFVIIDKLEDTILGEAGAFTRSWCGGLIGFCAEFLINISHNATLVHRLERGLSVRLLRRKVVFLVTSLDHASFSHWQINT